MVVIDHAMGQRIEHCHVVLPLEDRTLQGRGIESYTPHHQFLEFRRLNERIPKMILVVKTQVLETQCLQFARDRFVSRLKPDRRATARRPWVRLTIGPDHRHSSREPKPRTYLHCPRPLDRDPSPEQA